MLTGLRCLTPAKASERWRLEAAREQVESGAEPIEAVAACTGFGDPDRMGRAFIRAFGQPPQALRRTANIGLFRWRRSPHKATDLAERIVTEARESHGRVKPGHFDDWSACLG